MESKEEKSADEAQSEYKLHQQKKHEGWNTPQEVIDDAVTKATGSPVATHERIVDGESNEVYSVKTESGQEIIVRFFHGDKNKFEKARWSLAQCKDSGVPVSNMILVDSIESGGKTLHRSVETKLGGVGLDKATEADSSKSEDLLRQLGDALSKVHSIKTHGFGKLDKDGNGMFGSVPELIRGDKYISRENILPYFAKKPDNLEAIEHGYDVLEKEATHYTTTTSHLIHNDLSPKHILVDGGRISGLIDFDDAVGGDPMLDFALWDFKFGKKYPLSQLKAGYANKDVFSEGWEKRLNFWKIYRAFSSLRYCINAGKQEGIERAVKVIKESSEYFDTSA